MSPNLTLYFTTGSPPARACLLLARYLKLDIDVKQVNLTSGEHYSEEFSKLNPVNKVPVLVDGDFVLTESRAILAYLVSTRQPGSDLYPSGPQERALVDQRLYYDATNVFEKLAQLVRPGIFHKVRTVSKERKDAVREVLKVLNGFLSGNEYFAGDKLTIADFSILTSVTSFVEMGYDMSEYSNLNKWYEMLKSLPDFEENLDGAKYLAGILKDLVDEPMY